MCGRTVNYIYRYEQDGHRIGQFIDSDHRKMKRLLQRLDWGSEMSRETLSESSEEELLHVIMKTQYDQEQIVKVFREFHEISNRMSPIDPQKFQQLMERSGVSRRIDSIPRQMFLGLDEEIPIHLSESMVHKEVMKSLFYLFDTNRDGKIDFAEYLMGCSVLNSDSLEYRARASFHLFDQNGDGVITRDDLLITTRRSMRSAKKIFSNSTKNLKDLGKDRINLIHKRLDFLNDDRTLHLMVEEFFSIADTDHTGQITVDEFVAYVQENPNTLRVLNQLVQAAPVNPAPERASRANS